MTKRVGNTLRVEKETAQQCDYCGKVAELRPYGRGGACICFQCAMLDEDETERQFANRLSGKHRIDNEPS